MCLTGVLDFKGRLLAEQRGPSQLFNTVLSNLQWRLGKLTLIPKNKKPTDPARLTQDHAMRWREAPPVTHVELPSFVPLPPRSANWAA